MPLYFAYGANMDVDAMAVRCPGSTALGPARLLHHRLAIMREGWLTVVEDARVNVHGVLWDLALADVEGLDGFEEVSARLYAKLVLPVVAPGGPERALVYVGNNSGPGQANAEYIAAVLKSARLWNFSPEGIAPYERLAHEAGLKREAPSATSRSPIRRGFALPLDRQNRLQPEDER